MLPLNLFLLSRRPALLSIVSTPLYMFSSYPSFLNRIFLCEGTTTGIRCQLPIRFLYLIMFLLTIQIKRQKWVLVLIISWYALLPNFCLFCFCLIDVSILSDTWMNFKPSPLVLSNLCAFKFVKYKLYGELSLDCHKVDFDILENMFRALHFQFCVKTTVRSFRRPGKHNCTSISTG